uniref:Uncharacterized protein n=1 Tax=Eutreptiella gymnastica TaxID=73025 RepID=A0A7S1NWC3_9EUGL
MGQIHKARPRSHCGQPPPAAVTPHGLWGGGGLGRIHNRRQPPPFHMGCRVAEGWAKALPRSQSAVCSPEAESRCPLRAETNASPGPCPMLCFQLPKDVAPLPGTCTVGRAAPTATSH